MSRVTHCFTVLEYSPIIFVSELLLYRTVISSYPFVSCFVQADIFDLHHEQQQNREKKYRYNDVYEQKDPLDYFGVFLIHLGFPHLHHIRNCPHVEQQVQLHPNRNDPNERQGQDQEENE